LWVEEVVTGRIGQGQVDACHRARAGLAGD
jgi:hypothetical protein